MASNRPCPIRRVHTRTHITMERRMRLIHRLRHMPVFHRVVVDVVDMMFQIIFVANEMLPIPPLPQTALTLQNPRSASVFILGDTPRKCGFDMSPTHGVTRIALRQGPKTMQMVRQNHDCINRERPRPMPRTESIAQIIDAIHQQGLRTLRDGDGEEIGATRQPGSTIVRHGHSIAAITPPPHRSTLRTTVRKPRPFAQGGHFAHHCDVPVAANNDRSKIHCDDHCCGSSSFIAVGWKPTLQPSSTPTCRGYSPLDHPIVSADEVEKSHLRQARRK